jgi:hypothetical protein
MIRMADELWQQLNRDLRMRRASRTFFVQALSLFIVLGLAGCNASVRRSGIPAGAQAALQTAIDDIDAGRYDKLYQEASDEWRSQSSSEESNATLQKNARQARARAHAHATDRARRADLDRAGCRVIRSA